MLLNDEKSILFSLVFCILGYEIRYTELQPDPSRLEALENMSLPSSKKSLQQMTGLFAYYSRWIPRYSERLHLLVDAVFPLPKEAGDAISDTKRAICSSVKTAVDENLPFTVETDASDYAIGAYAIIESVRKWCHYLSGKDFSLVTDQKSVSFLFDVQHKGKVKNEKILLWRIELMPYSFDIQNRPGNLNSAADALSGSSCAIANSRIV